MAKTQILDYYIHIRNAEVAAALQAQMDATPPTGPGTLLVLPTGGLAILRAPNGAATEFAIAEGTYPPQLPIINVGDAIPSTSYISSPWFTISNAFPRDVATFTKSSGWWIFGSNTKFYWAGHIVAEAAPSTTSPPAAGPEPTERENVTFGFPTRYFLHGSSLGSGAEVSSATLNTGGGFTKTNRAAARAGIGNGIRSANAAAVARDQMGTGVFGTGVVKMWQRIYFRPYRYGGSSHTLWRSNIFAVSGTGYSLGVTANGQFALYDMSAGGATETLIGAFGQTVIGEQSRLDLFQYVDAAADVHYIDISVNGTSLISGTRAIGGLAGNRYLDTQEIGNFVTTNDAHVFDLADWVGAALPRTHDRSIAAFSALTTYALNDVVKVGTKTYRSKQGSNLAHTPGGAVNDWWQLLSDPVDVAFGSKLVRATPDGFGASHANWTGTYALLAQRPITNQSDNLTSTTSGAVAHFTTDIATRIDALPGSQGWVSFRTVCSSSRGTTSGTLGYQVGTDPEVNTPITQGASLPAFNAIQYTTALTTPVKGVALKLKHVKGADVGTARLAALFALMECIGIFGPEDVEPTTDPDADVSDTTFPNPVDLQVCDYPASPWAITDLPLGPVVIVTGTYNGNSDFNPLSFKAPPTFLRIRPLSGAGLDGGQYWAGMLGAHYGVQQGIGRTIAPKFRQNLGYAPASDTADQQMEFFVDLAGIDAGVNLTGVTYQYVAFCDPARRFAITHASGGSNANAPFTDPLRDPAFLPEFSFISRQEISATATVGMYAKGPGHAAAGAQGLNASTALTNGLTWGTGQVTLGVDFVSNVFGWNEFPQIHFRRADGNNNPDQTRVMFLGQYTGDGNASRTIGISPTSGRRPMSLMVMPANAAAFFRDPSHTGTNSTNSAGTNSTTAITAGGIDQFTVGSTLNANGIVYNYFGFPGCDTAGNGGWSPQCEVTIASDSRNPSDWTEPDTIDPDEEEEPTDDDDPGDLDTDIATNCVAASTRICNMALVEAGITKQISNLATDPSQEAVVCRLIYKTLVDAVLQDYPWHFATAYTTAGLTLIGGTSTTAVVPDWQYSYRLPADCLRVRRIVDPAVKRQFSKTPIPFNQSADAGGTLLYADEPFQYIQDGDPVNIEYTKRIDCPASVRDAAFRHCLVLRLVAGLAKAMGRDSKDADNLFIKYRAALPVVKVQHANDHEPQRPSDGDPDWISGR